MRKFVRSLYLSLFIFLLCFVSLIFFLFFNSIDIRIPKSLKIHAMPRTDGEANEKENY